MKSSLANLRPASFHNSRTLCWDLNLNLFLGASESLCPPWAQGEFGGESRGELGGELREELAGELPGATAFPVASTDCVAATSLFFRIPPDSQACKRPR